MQMLESWGDRTTLIRLPASSFKGDEADALFWLRDCVLPLVDAAELAHPGPHLPRRSMTTILFEIPLVLSGAMGLSEFTSWTFLSCATGLLPGTVFELSSAPGFAPSVVGVGTIHSWQRWSTILPALGFGMGDLVLGDLLRSVIYFLPSSPLCCYFAASARSAQLLGWLTVASPFFARYARDTR